MLPLEKQQTHQKAMYLPLSYRKGSSLLVGYLEIYVVRTLTKLDNVPYRRPDQSSQVYPSIGRMT